MKKILFCLTTLLLTAGLPYVAFAEEQSTLSADLLMEIIWYVALAVLFGGGLIVISKWSKKINERDEELKQELAKKEEDAPNEQDCPEKSGDDASSPCEENEAAHAQDDR